MEESRRIKLLVQPGDGVAPLVKAITRAKKSVELVIFRFDQREIERALANAVSRGVAVQALIAHTNRAGEESLRRLEMRLLAAGVTVARTADDLVRYHAKYMIVDRRELYLMAFNLTTLDIERSRSFAIITRSRKLVAEAGSLFDADTQRHVYESGLDSFVVSPVNARKRLSALLKSAKKELLIYDLKISDQAMIHILEERAKAGVAIRVIGKLTRKIERVAVHKSPGMRLHTRSMMIDGRIGFIGSQSLRELELDARREVGVIFNDRAVVSRLCKIFEEDWTATDESLGNEADQSVSKVAKRVAKAVTRELPMVMPTLNVAVKDAAGERAASDLNPEEVEAIVKDAVKEAVSEALHNLVDGAAEKEAKARDKVPA